jgi:hypothetical protein
MLVCESCVSQSDDDTQLGLIARKASFDLLSGCRDIANAYGELKCSGATPGVEVIETDEGTLLQTSDASNENVTVYLFVLVGLAAACVLFLILTRSTGNPIDELADQMTRTQNQIHGGMKNVAGGIGDVANGGISGVVNGVASGMNGVARGIDSASMALVPSSDMDRVAML